MPQWLVFLKTRQVKDFIQNGRQKGFELVEPMITIAVIRSMNGLARAMPQLVCWPGNELPG